MMDTQLDTINKNTEDNNINSEGLMVITVSNEDENNIRITEENMKLSGKYNRW